MQLNIQGLELLWEKNSCLSEGDLHLGSRLLLKHNRYELLLNLSCSNVSSCLIGAVSPRIHWVVFFFFFPDWRHPSFLKQDPHKEILKTTMEYHSCTPTYPQVFLRKCAALEIFLVLKMPYELPLFCPPLTFLCFWWMKCRDVGEILRRLRFISVP